jgi:hypothetical protein
MMEGSCLCGAVRYEVQGALSSLLHCHCGRCRKHHGAPFASFVRVPRQQLRWQSAEEAVGSQPSSPARQRRFCVQCGSVAPSPHGAEHVLVPAGNLQGELDGSRGEHMFVGSKAVWHGIADELPRHEAAPPGWTSLEGVVERPTLDSAPLAGSTHGSCLCGAVTFTVSGQPSRWLQCHCSRCRRARSALHGSNTFYPAAQFAWRSGRELVKSYKPPEAERFTTSFCTRCGGGAPSVRENVPFVLVPAALLDGDPGARPQAHIHVASKAAWYSFHDALPQFAELPPP